MERSQLIFAVMLVCIGAVLAGAPYKDCGSKLAKIKDVEISGCAGKKVCPLKKGTNVTVTVEFTLNTPVKRATNVVHGIIAGVHIPFPLHNADACKDCGLACPLKTGQGYKYQTTIFVKSLYPSVKLVVQWEVKNKDSTDLICLLVPAEIVS